LKDLMLELLVRCHTLRHAGERKGSLREGLNYRRSLCELRCRPGTVAFRPAAAAPAAEPLVPVPQEAEPG
jgi:hypothetical protein